MKSLVIMLALASGAAQLTIRCNVVPVAMPPAQQPAAQGGSVQFQFPMAQELETTTSQTPFNGGTLVTTTVVLK